ncbi:MAG: hypothetical protein AB7X49_14220, partial [Geminicoccaceae bacterium]
MLVLIERAPAFTGPIGPWPTRGGIHGAYRPLDYLRRTVPVRRGGGLVLLAASLLDLLEADELDVGNLLGIGLGRRGFTDGLRRG